MINRFIKYGYKLLDGKYVPNDEEVLIVNEIFQKYAEGYSLKSIAEELNNREIIYFGDRCDWNKRRIASIIEERKYIGENNYPLIISYELFERANKIKNGKSYKPRACSKEVEACKTIVYCGQCGKRMYRKSMWDTREKWICYSGCKCSNYIDDKEIFLGIKRVVGKVKKDTTLLEASGDKSYEQTQEIIKCTNEITRLINSFEPNYIVGKKMILDCVNLKFQACKEDKSVIYTGKIKRFLSEYDENNINIEKIDDIVSKVIVNQNGTFTIEFVNGICISEEVVANASTSEKNNNKDRR